jgi:hypothetical protein
MVRRAKGVTAVENGDDDFTFKVARRGATGPMVMHLHNLWSDIQGKPAAERRATIKRYVLAMTAVAVTKAPTSWSDAAPQLMPAVRTGSFGRSSPLELISIPMMPFVQLFTALDHPDHMGFVTIKDATEWGIDHAVIRTRAAANLRGAALPTAQHPRVRGAHAVLGPDGYVSSWLAVPDRLRETAELLPGRPLAVAPTRDLLAVVGEDDAEAIMAILRWALEMFQESARGLSPVLYALDDSNLQQWVPKLDHPGASSQKLACLILEAAEYGHQAQSLADAVGDQFVPSVQVLQRRDGAPRSVTVWTRGVRALLPRAEFVHLNDVKKQETAFTVRWEDAMAVASDSVEFVTDLALDTALPRWRVTDWPPPDVVERLRALTVDLEKP